MEFLSLLAKLVDFFCGFFPKYLPNSLVISGNLIKFANRKYKYYSIWIQIG